MRKNWFRKYPVLKKASAVMLAAVIASGSLPAVLPPGVSIFAGSEVHAAESSYKKCSLDLSNGLHTGTEYGDSDVAVFSVLENMNVKSGVAKVDGVTYSSCVQGSHNAKPNAGKVPSEGAAFKIVAKADSRIYFALAKATNKKWHFVDEETNTDLNTDGASLTKDNYTFNMTGGHTYYFYLDGSKAKVYAITLSKGRPEVDWDKVAAPELAAPVLNEGKDTLSIPYKALIGDEGGEELLTEVILDGSVIDTISSKVSGESGTLTYSPEKSGSYTFRPVLKREGKADKAGKEVTLNDFVLPLSKPQVLAVTDKGSGSVEVTFKSVKEAENYIVSYSSDGQSYTDLTPTTTSPFTFNVPETGKEYSFKVAAIRGNDRSESDPEKHTVGDKWMATWLFSTYGSNASTDPKDSGYEKLADGSVEVWNKNTKGKLVPASTDGVSFYYTRIPSDKNFTLSAEVKVNKWIYSNGQEGFGLMASDAVGKNGDGSSFWNNSYMASVTKVSYNYDRENGKVTDDTSYPLYTMKLGVGSQEKIGVTKDNLASLQNNDTAVITKDFSSTMTTLESLAGEKGDKDGGTYNIVGNLDEKSVPAGPALAQYTTFKLVIQKNNTGYFVSYIDENGKTHTQKYYDTKALEKLDPDYVYAGIFAARNADVTASNIELTLIDPDKDAAPEQPEVKRVTPYFGVVSPSTANSSSYNMRLMTNYDGEVKVLDGEGKTLGEAGVKAGEAALFPVTLNKGKNTFTAIGQPDSDYKPAKNSVLSSYDEIKTDVSINYYNYDGDIIYTGPKANGKGSKNDPASIYEAVKYAAPGQTIVLLPGKYDLDKGLVIPLGTNGNSDKKISLVADPSSEERPVLDFSKARDTIGLELAGDYWYLKGFDVTGSSNGKDGIHVSGSHNVLDQVRAYHNGNTGIQLSRIGTQQAREEWPSYNTILNCTSYANADNGFEDADGFAAKLTIGEGNVFDGCISYNNADDGWDLFAKPETGSIGAVTIKNCLAFGNGYGEDGTDEGNGNGFKMGGSSLSGYHKLINSVSFNNKAKGIDSNSCPDIQIENNISFNNGGSNVALYTTDAKNTDFSAKGIISYRKGTDVNETIKPVGSQDIKKIYQSSDYYWKNALGDSHDSSKEVSDDWFISIDTGFDSAKHIFQGMPVTRNADGTINMNGLLVLTDKAIKSIGQKNACLVSGKPSESIKLSGNETTGLKTDPDQFYDQNSGKDSVTVPEKNTNETADRAVLPTKGEDGLYHYSADVVKAIRKNAVVNIKIERDQTTKKAEIRTIKVSPETKLTDEKGNEVKLSDAKFFESESGKAYEKAVSLMKEALKDKNIIIPEGSKLSIVEAYFSDKTSGAKLSANGEIVVTFKMPYGTSKEGYKFRVYHLRDDGTIEVLDPEVSSDSLSVAVTSLSPFAIVAVPETKTSPKTGGGIPQGLPIVLLLSAGTMLIMLKKRI